MYYTKGVTVRSNHSKAGFIKVRRIAHSIISHKIRTKMLCLFFTLKSRLNKSVSSGEVEFFLIVYFACCHTAN